MHLCVQLLRFICGSAITEAAHLLALRAMLQRRRTSMHRAWRCSQTILRHAAAALPLEVCNCWALQRCCCLAVQAQQPGCPAAFRPWDRVLPSITPRASISCNPHLQACNNWGLVLQDLSSLRPSAERPAYLHHSLSKFRRAIRLRPDFDRACEAYAACDWPLQIV